MQTDIDGRSSYSQMRVVRFSADMSPFTVLGNPVSNGILQLSVHQATNISLYEISGKLLWKQLFTSGWHNVDVSRYAQGMYLLSTNGKTQKIFIE